MSSPPCGARQGRRKRRPYSPYDRMLVVSRTSPRTARAIRSSVSPAIETISATVAIRLDIDPSALISRGAWTLVQEPAHLRTARQGVRFPPGALVFKVGKSDGSRV